jgi:hypothetical protein
MLALEAADDAYVNNASDARNEPAGTAVRATALFISRIYVRRSATLPIFASEGIFDSLMPYALQRAERISRLILPPPLALSSCFAAADYKFTS